MRVVFEGAYGDLRLLDSPNKVLKELGFFKNNRVIEDNKHCILSQCVFSERVTWIRLLVIFVFVFMPYKDDNVRPYGVARTDDER